MGLPRSQRIRIQADFDRIRDGGWKGYDKAFFMQVLPPEPGAAPALFSRAAVVASKRQIGDAVHRNFARRRMRELFRLHGHLLPPGCSVVMTARPGVVAEPFIVLEERFCRLCAKASAALGGGTQGSGVRGHG